MDLESKNYSMPKEIHSNIANMPKEVHSNHVS